MNNNTKLVLALIVFAVLYYLFFAQDDSQENFHYGYYPYGYYPYGYYPYSSYYPYRRYSRWWRRRPYYWW